MRTLIALLLLAGCYSTEEPVGFDGQYGISGLYTNANPAMATPDGALLRAEEVDVVRPGMAQPRPGFKAGTANDLDYLHKLIPYAGGILKVGKVGATERSEWGSGLAISTELGSDLAWARNAWFAAEARKNLYVTTSDCVRKMTSATSVLANRAGLLAPVTVIQSSSATGPIGAGNTVAYRAILRRRDVNGLTISGAPSGRALYQPAAAATATVRVYLHALLGVAADYNASVLLGIDPGYSIELYRTLNSTTAEPPDELFLAAIEVLSSTDISNGYHDFVDVTIDDALGAALYTNASREGIERSNVPPPLATDLTLYKGSLFAANLTYPHGMLETYIDSGITSLAGSATGIGARAYTATKTNGSNQLTVLSGTAGLQVGMIVVPVPNFTNWSGTGPIIVTAISGTTATLSSTYSGGTAGGASFVFYDSIVIATSANGAGAEYFTAFSALLPSQISAADATYRTAASVIVTAQSLGDASFVTVPGQPIGGQAHQVYLQRPLPSSAAFYAWATHGAEYQPALPLPTASLASGQASAQDVFPHGITWSKQDEPEHFMVGTAAVWLVGKQQSPALRVLGTKDALWILKGRGDGVYRLNGFGERSGWRVDPWDSDTYIIHPELAILHGDTLYAWTNQGAVMIDDSGVTPINAAINDQTRDLQQLLDHTSQPYAFAVSNFKDDSIIFGLPRSTLIASGNAVVDTFVYRAPSRGWVKWFANGFTGRTTMAYDPATRLLSLGTNTTGRPYIERAPGDTVLNADIEIAVTVNSVTGLSVVIAGASDWTPTVGDLIARGGVYAIVATVTDATHFTVSTSGLTSGSATAYVAFVSRLSWLPKTGGSSATVKRYVAQYTHWDETEGVYGWSTVMGASQNPGTEVSIADTRTYQRSTATRADTRALCPRDVAMSPQLYPSVEIRQADSRWRITGLTIDAENVSGRSSR